MTYFLRVISVLSLVFVLSCTIGALKKEEVDPWLKTISGDMPHELNLTGKWYDPNGNVMMGWGEGYMRQEGNKVNGAIGSYNIRGVVSGKKVYLIFLHGGSVYYTGRFEMFEGDLLVGNYFEANDKKQENGYPTSLARKK